MAAIAWSEMMSVGVPSLDADHKTLIGLINTLQRAIGDDEEYATVGSVLRALEDYVAHHFSREERVMAVCRYPSAAAHGLRHRQFTDRIGQLRAAYEADPGAVQAGLFLEFLRHWLIDHICSSDMDYRPWAVGHADSLMRGDGESLGGGVSLDWKSLRVLAVDDNRNFGLVLRTVLEGVGVADIRVVGDVETAKAALAAKGVDVLVADWHIGAQNGLDLVAWVRGRPELAGLPVLILSGHERAANRDVALSAGADDFMEKPISARGLLLSLARLLRKGGGG